MIRRGELIAHLLKWKDKKMVKVITGVRRSGKSILIQQYMEELLAMGVKQEHMVYLNFESLKNEHLLSYQKLYDHVMEMCDPNHAYYLFFDEIQLVEEWEKAIASFRVDLNCDIYITGSNAYLLSSEIATLLSGRSVSIQVLPLSFKEFLSGAEGMDKEEAFQYYMRYGGFPGLLELFSEDRVKQEYLEGIYNTVVVKDILSRTGITDTDLLNRLFKFLVMHIGTLVSANKIANYLNSNGASTHVGTIIDYLNAFEKAFILYKTNRYDMKGKKILRSPDKYYLCDTGLRGSVLGFEVADFGRVLENMVYLELIRRGNAVLVGTGLDGEIDFISNDGKEKRYYQVSLSVVDEKVRERELNAFRRIRDQHPKILLTMDFGNGKNEEGIEFRNIVDWLLE